jgi:uncharacterized protein Veg
LFFWEGAWRHFFSRKTFVCILGGENKFCAAHKNFKHKISKKGNTWNMIKTTSSLSGVKAAISQFYEREVSVRVNLGRNKIVEYEGRLSGVYPALFTVSPNGKDFCGKTTYAYSEVLCGNVSVRLKE